MINRKNLHLAVSSALISIVALGYGLDPERILPELFEFEIRSADLIHVFRTTLFLYFAMAILWTMGIFKPAYWRSATLANVFFMLGLATGRLISLMIDGIPSTLFVVGLGLEIILGVRGIINLRKYRE